MKIRLIVRFVDPEVAYAFADDILWAWAFHPAIESYKTGRSVTILTENERLQLPILVQAFMYGQIESMSMRPA
jgi:hypothetical protein